IRPEPGPTTRTDGSPLHRAPPRAERSTPVNPERISTTTGDTADLLDTIEQSLSRRDLAAASAALDPMSPRQVVEVLERLGPRQRAVLYRLLAKPRALEVFEELEPELQGELLRGLQDAEVAA